MPRLSARLLLLLAAVAVWVGLGLGAAPRVLAGNGASGVTFGSIDRNGDGCINWVEFHEKFPNLRYDSFVVLDRNHDGCINQPEWLLFLKQQAVSSSSGAVAR